MKQAWVRGLAGMLIFMGTGIATSGENPALEKNGWRIQPAHNSSTVPEANAWKKVVQPAKGVNSFWYEQTATVPAVWEGKRIYLDFSRIEGDAIVFVNDKRVGELLRPGGEIEITAAAKAGAENRVRVFVTRDYTDISRSFEQDRLRYVCRNHMTGKVPMERWGVGISGEAELLCRASPAGLADIVAETSWRKKELAFAVEIDATQKTDGLVLAAEVFDQEGKKVLDFKGPAFSAPEGRSTVRLASAWGNPHTWELDDGYLYSAQIRLMKNGAALEQAPPLSFGFREIWTEGRNIMLNGHESNWRLALLHNPLTFGDSSPKGMAFARLLGYNAGYIQAHPELWWRGCGWAAETPTFSQPLLDAADRAGFAVLLPAPSVAFLGTAVYDDPVARRDYERETKLHMRHYRNHPCVLSWIVGMNSVGFANEAIAPQKMGIRFEAKRLASGQGRAIAEACAIAKSADPARLAYSHADGNIGDIASTNCYLNFAQLQEREEWPQHWAEKGDMPYMMAEFGPPYTANFWKGKRFLPTEYFAIYFGSRAYEEETDTGLARLIAAGMENKNTHGTHGSASLIYDDGKAYPLFWDFQRLFVGNTNRAFRLWGVNGGWAYWSMSTGYGKPSGKSFEDLPLCVSRPEWASPNFDIERLANQPLLACLAGGDSPTDKTHTYYSGEEVKKSVAFVWDGPGKTVLAAEWSVSGKDGKTLATGKVRAELSTGERARIPFSFHASEVTQRSDFMIRLSVLQDGSAAGEDSFPVAVFPKNNALHLKSKVALYDPLQKSAPWLTALGVGYSAVRPGDDLSGYDLLIVGREAVSPGEDLPYKPADIRRGLKVLVLEQLPAGWRGLGFRSNEAMPRRVFPVAPQTPLMTGLQLTDLQDWRGAPDLLPAGLNQSSDTRHAPKWTNTHAVASSIPQIPRAVGFCPLLSAEFDLDYAPLLEWRGGKGVLLLCGLDLTGRVPNDPAATVLAGNLLRYLDTTKEQVRRKVLSAGGEATPGFLKRLGTDAVPFTGKEDPADSLLVVGESGIPVAQAQQFAQAGGVVFFLPQAPAALAEYGLKTSAAKIQRVPAENDPLFRNIGRNLLRWRDTLDLSTFTAEGQPAGVNVLAGGIAAVKPVGKGMMVFCQIAPALLQTKYAKDKERAEAVDLSVIRLEQLIARLLGNLGAESSGLTAERLALCLDTGSQYEPLKNWSILGPYRVENDDGAAMLDTKFSAEEMARAGDANPNITFPADGGKVFDWRNTLNPDKSGFVNMGAFYKVESKAVAYAATTLTSANDRSATLRVGCDWRMILWVNGKEVFRTLSGKNIPGSYYVRVPLKKGENTISLKLGSGSKGFGFYLDITKEVKPAKIANLQEMKAVSFYAGRTPEEEFDPYFFTYW